MELGLFLPFSLNVCFILSVFLERGIVFVCIVVFFVIVGGGGEGRGQ